jgi:hypothetical protein
MTRRDKGATLRLLNILEPCWSNGRIEYEIQERRLPWRGHVQGRGDVASNTIKPDWTVAAVDRDSNEMTLIWLDGDSDIVEAVEVSPPRSDRDNLPPTAAPPAPEAPPPAPEAPPPAPEASPPAAALAQSKNVSEEALRHCIREIMADHAEKLPDRPPPDEGAVHREMEDRLGARIQRDRVRQVLNEHPRFKLPVGRPRKDA